jgi:hypothetical protein
VVLESLRAEERGPGEVAGTDLPEVAKPR